MQTPRVKSQAKRCSHINEDGRIAKQRLSPNFLLTITVFGEKSMHYSLPCFKYWIPNVRCDVVYWDFLAVKSQGVPRGLIFQLVPMGWEVSIYHHTKCFQGSRPRENPLTNNFARTTLAWCFGSRMPNPSMFSRKIIMLHLTLVQFLSLFPP